MAIELRSIFSMIYKIIFDSVVYVLLISILIGILPDKIFKGLPISPTKYEFPKHIPTDKLPNWNTILDDASEFLLKDKIIGPESMVEVNGLIYTGLMDGRIIQINKKTGNFKEVTRITTSKNCKDLDGTNVQECGRPLGIRYHDNNLYVLEAYQGLFVINLKTGQKQLINFNFPPNTKGFFNDFVFDPTLNVVYISVSSTKWQIDRVPWSILEYENSGMVLAGDLTTKKVHKIATGFYFTNGIDIVNDNLLISETLNFRILKIPLTKVHRAIKAEEKVLLSNIEIFAQLPGEPDNIRVHDNDVWVAIFSPRIEGKQLRDYLGGWPIVRKSLARLLYGTSTILNFINTNLWQCDSIESLANQLYTGHIVYDYVPKSGAVLRLNGQTGAMKQLLGTTTFGSISEAYVDSDGDLYLGSFRNRFLVRVKKGKY